MTRISPGEAVLDIDAEPVRLLIGGMTCASCAARVERKLNRMEGVSASVNYATEKATVRAVGVAVEELIRTVERTGYSAELVTPQAPAAPEDTDDRRVR
ncbi:MAG: heavy-metal-associated domain-containing protein, partial [Nonomuraea sp.]|nr:heavy-metal-associated domain-containing protein [Nonomuraea sp.]